MRNQPRKYPRTRVDPVHRLLVLVVEQTQVGSEEVAGQEGQYLLSLKHAHH